MLFWDSMSFWSINSFLKFLNSSIIFYFFIASYSFINLTYILTYYFSYCFYLNFSVSSWILSRDICLNSTIFSASFWSFNFFNSLFYCSSIFFYSIISFYLFFIYFTLYSFYKIFSSITAFFDSSLTIFLYSNSFCFYYWIFFSLATLRIYSSYFSSIYNFILYS
jgi:hypothetical protein